MVAFAQILSHFGQYTFVSRYFCGFSHEGSVLKIIPIVVGLTALALSSAANAQAYPTFSLDADASSVMVTETGCYLSCPDFSGDVGADADSFSWTPTSADESTFVDVFEWSSDTARRFATGAQTFDVTAELVFDSPNPASTSAGGEGFAFTLFGSVSGGVLNWASAAPITFDDGSELEVVFEDVNFLTTDVNATVLSGVTFIGNLLQPLDNGGGSTIATPLPASVWMLFAGMGAAGYFGAGRRRRRKA